MAKRHLRLSVDVLMTLILPLLMAYSLIGEAFHEIAGTAMMVLFIIHHILNLKWFSSLARGKYNAARVFRTIVDVLLLVFMVLQPLSGILMSRHLYTFLPPLPVSAQARGVHMLLAYWGYALIGIHAGTHLTLPLSKLGKRKAGVRIPVCCLLCGISAYGGYAFVKRGFPGYMTGRTVFAFFDYDEPVMFFILDYLAIMFMFMLVGFLVCHLLNERKTS